MAMEGPEGRIEQTGIRVMEVYTMHPVFDERNRERYFQGPEAFLNDYFIRFLDRHGLRVNSIRHIGDRLPNPFEDDQCKYQIFHVVYPPEEASQWIWECV